MDPAWVVVLSLFVITLVIALIAVGPFVWWWLVARKEGNGISFLRLVGMKLRRVPPGVIVPALVLVHRHKLGIDETLLEVHFMAGGNPTELVEAMVRARELGLDVDYRRLAALDLCQIPLMDAVERAVHPQTTEQAIADCPTMTTGSTVNLKATITSRLHLNRLIGGMEDNALFDAIDEFVKKHSDEYLSTTPTEEELARLADRIKEQGLDVNAKSAIDDLVLQVDHRA